MGKDRLFWSWDRQQQSEIPNREIRFETILDTLDAYLPENFTALDLGSGPGALSFRILKRFPRARMIAVDFDPVLLKIGKDGLGTFGRRATFVDADLRANDWIQKLPIKKFDAAVSSTAIHWLDRKGLQNMYRNLAKVLRPQAIFLDADILPDGKGSRATEIAEKIRFQKYGTLENEFASHGKWWDRLERNEKNLGTFFQDRKARFAASEASEKICPIETHRKLLRESGFKEFSVIWQDAFQSRILMGIR